MHARRLGAIGSARWLQTRQASSHYDTLGVGSDASVARIKTAFREKAKLHHPDAVQRPGTAEWIQILTPYQVLTDVRSRELYDLSRAAGVPPLMRKAAAAAGEADEEQEIDLTWGLGRFMRRHDVRSGNVMLDRLRGELDRHVAATISFAKKCSSCDAWVPRSLSPQRPARCAETRIRWPALGRAGCRPAARLLRGGRALHSRQPRGAAAGVGQAATGGGQGVAASAAEPRRAAALPCRLGSGGWADSALTAAPAAPWHNAPGCGHQQQQPSLATDRLQSRHHRAGASLDLCSGGDGENFELLEVVMGEEVTAAALRRSTIAAEPTPASGGSDCGTPENSERCSSSSSSCSSSTSTNTSSSSIRFYLQGRYTKELRSVHEAATAHTASAARLVDSAGRHTHSVLRSTTPLVRHITFVSELRESAQRQQQPGRQRLRTRGGSPAVGDSNAVVARCRRAWLPHSSLWPFPPRSYHHDIGGYYIEWAGHAKEGRHPAWLHPAIIALTAAFDTLDNERAARQPQGLFSRLRQGDETAGGVAAWVKAMLRFHR